VHNAYVSFLEAEAGMVRCCTGPSALMGSLGLDQDTLQVLLDGTVMQSLGSAANTNAFDSHKAGNSVCIDEDSLYIVKYSVAAVKVFSHDGVLLVTFGATSSGCGVTELNRPSGVCIRGQLVFIADSFNHRVQILRLSGEYVRTIGSGVEGGGPTELRYPSDVAVSSALVCIADKHNGRVQIFDHEGNYIRSVDTQSASAASQHTTSIISSVCLFNDTLYICDIGNHCVHIYDIYGKWIHTLGSGVSGSSNEQFHSPQAVSVSETGIFVADCYNSRIQVFNMDRSYSRSIGMTVNGRTLFPSSVSVSGSGECLFVSGSYAQ